jgi:hypothetical protein
MVDSFQQRVLFVTSLTHSRGSLLSFQDRIEVIKESVSVERSQLVQYDMPWLSQESYPLPAEDLVSFSFGNTDYDNDKPVGSFAPLMIDPLTHYRSTMMPTMNPGQYHVAKVFPSSVNWSQDSEKLDLKKATALPSPPSTISCTPWYSSAE